jgi:hypothetical protein
MQATKDFFGDRKTFVAAGFLGCMVLWILLLVGQHLGAMRRVSESKAAGLASVTGGFNPLGQWIYRKERAALNSPAHENTLSSTAESTSQERKVVRKGTLRLRILDVSAFLRNGAELGRRLGGYVVASNESNATPSAQGILVLAVPVAQFDIAMEQLRSLAAAVDGSKTEAADVTKRYVDSEATLRSYRAEESQYLLVLREARKIPDIMQVTDKLFDVRKRIENTEGEFRYLQHEVTMANITAEFYVQTPVPIVSWRASNAFREGWDSMLHGLKDFADGAIYLAFQLPVLLLWLFALWSAVAGAWRAFRWVRRHWFNGARVQQA